MAGTEYIITEWTACPKLITFCKSQLWIHWRGIFLNLFFFFFLAGFCVCFLVIYSRLQRNIFCPLDFKSHFLSQKCITCLLAFSKPSSSFSSSSNINKIRIVLFARSNCSVDFSVLRSPNHYPVGLPETSCLNWLWRGRGQWPRYMPHSPVASPLLGSEGEQCFLARGQSMSRLLGLYRMSS